MGCMYTGCSEPAASGERSASIPRRAPDARALSRCRRPAHDAEPVDSAAEPIAGMICSCRVSKRAQQRCTSAVRTSGINDLISRREAGAASMTRRRSRRNEANQAEQCVKSLRRADGARDHERQLQAKWAPETQQVLLFDRQQLYTTPGAVSPRSLRLKLPRLTSAAHEDANQPHIKASKSIN